MKRRILGTIIACVMIVSFFNFKIEAKTLEVKETPEGVVKNLFEELELSKDRGESKSNKQLQSLFSAGERRRYISGAKNTISLLDLYLEVASLESGSLKEENKKLLFEDVKQEKREGVVVVSFILHKKWNYVGLDNLESETIDKMSVLFKKENNEWKISGIDGLTNYVLFVDDEFGDDQISFDDKDCLVKKYNDNVRKQKEVAIINPVKMMLEHDNLLRGTNYNRYTAIEYAMNHALSYNPNYHDFRNEGGDCTNFVSQCFAAGGIRQKTGNSGSVNCWYYRSAKDRSATWTGAAQLNKYLKGGSSNIDIELTNFDHIDVGDLISLSNKKSGVVKHSIFVTGIVWASYGHQDLIICAHTTNRRNVSYNSYYYSGWNSEFIHVKGNK